MPPRARLQGLDPPLVCDEWAQQDVAGAELEVLRTVGGTVPMLQHRLPLRRRWHSCG